MPQLSACEIMPTKLERLIPMPTPYTRYATQAASWILAAAAGAAALWILWLSRYQPIEWDQAMLHYSAFLINEKGFILYRDIFENNLPGTFLFHVVLGKTIGYEALPMRLVDFSILAGITLAAWNIISPISKPAAVLAPSLFVGLYLFTGTTVALQRDYIGILPIAIAVALITRKTLTPLLTSLALGALCAFACGFKPNYILLYPALYLLLIHAHSEFSIGEKFRLFIRMGFSFLTVFLIPIIWGLYKADYSELISIYKTFTPIYVQSRIDLYHFNTPQEQLTELAHNQMVHMRNCLFIAAPGLAWAFFNTDSTSHARKQVVTIGAVTAVFSFYELLAGKFWLAHLLPSYFWNIVSFSLLLTPSQKMTTWKNQILAFSVIAIAMLATHFVLSATIQKTSNSGYTKSNDHIRSQKIARYLKDHLKQGDTVQGIDGSGDGQGSLLIAGATVSTRYLEDIPLYMQPDAPATQAFRKEFLNGLQQKKPAYIVYIHNIFHPAGGNRLKEFSALSEFIDRHYDEAVLDEGEYTIYRRKSDYDH